MARDRARQTFTLSGVSSTSKFFSLTFLSLMLSITIHSGPGIPAGNFYEVKSGKMVVPTVLTGHSSTSDQRFIYQDQRGDDWPQGALTGARLHCILSVTAGLLFTKALANGWLCSLQPLSNLLQQSFHANPFIKLLIRVAGTSRKTHPAVNLYPAPERSEPHDGAPAVPNTPCTWCQDRPAPPHLCH